MDDRTFLASMNRIIDWYCGANRGSLLDEIARPIREVRSNPVCFPWGLSIRPYMCAIFCMLSDALCDWMPMAWNGTVADTAKPWVGNTAAMAYGEGILRHAEA